MAKKVIEVNDANIQKALETFGIKTEEKGATKEELQKAIGEKQEELDEIKKAFDREFPEAMGKKKEKKKDDEDIDEEDIDEEDIDEEDIDEDDEKEKRKKKEIKKSEKKEDIDDEDDENDGDKEEEKGKKEIKKASVEEKLDAIAILMKANLDKVDSLSEDLEETQNALTKANKKLAVIENQPLGRKSFAKIGYLEKAFQENEDSGKKMLSKSQHKKEIINLLTEKSGIEKGKDVNEKYVDAILQFEASNSISKAIIDDLSQNDSIEIVG